MIDKTVKYFTNQRNEKIKFEIIIVNDGSKDNTQKVIDNLIKKYQNVVEIAQVTYKNNAGKGYAVATGFKYSRGEYILMLDADGATNIQDFEILMKDMNKIKSDENVNGELIIGSRKLNSDVKVILF